MNLRVRFSDTDMLGHVNNSRYFTFMEEARVHFVEEEIKFTKLPLILASAKVDFRAQTFYTQTLRIESWVSRIGNSSFDIACQMFDAQTNQLQFEGIAVLVYFDYETQKPARVPTDFREALEKYFEPVDQSAPVQK